MQTEKTLLEQPARRDRPGDNPRVGFGAWAIGGGGWEFGWGPQADDESIAAIHHALDLDVNWIDTAAVYGFRAFRAGGGPRPGGTRRRAAPAGVHQVVAVGGPRREGGQQPRARLDPAGSRGKPAPAPGRRDRPLPDPLGPFRTRTSRKAGPRSPSSRSRAGCGTSACPTSASSSYGGHSGSLRSKPCSRPTH